MVGFSNFEKPGTVMKSFFLVVVCLALCCTSCDEKAKNVSMKANATTRVFVEKMKNGQTTREEEQKFVELTAELVFEVDRALRGTEKAEETKKKAAAIASGLDPEAPLRIFEEEKDSSPKAEPVTP